MDRYNFSVNIVNMLTNMRKLIIYLVPLFIVFAGLAIVYFKESGSKTERGIVFSIDYKKLEDLAKKRPLGDKYLNFVRENKALLHDDDMKNDADAYINIGFNIRALGDDAMAIAAYEEGLKLDPNNSYGLNNIATSYIAIGELTKAQDAYRRLTKALVGDSAAYINLSEVHEALHPNDEEGFAKIMEEGIAVSAGADKASLLNRLGVYFRDKGDSRKAIEYFKKLLEMDPSNARAREEIESLKNYSNYSN